jgi:uridine phosphorylase
MPIKISATELILNPNGSVYHLNVLPEDIGETVLLVGDPDRVPEVSKHFDTLQIQKQKREFITHTGTIGSNRVSVISTGIGTDNIDIVLNELDALVNIDLHTREVKSGKHDLSIVRIGTSGAVQADIPVDSILVSTFGLGLDQVLCYYEVEPAADVSDVAAALGLPFLQPYIFAADEGLLARFNQTSLKGLTATCCGFYAPQGRKMRVATRSENLITNLQNLALPQGRVTNFEMETAAILGLSKVFGFKAVSVNAIVANRITHQFSANPQAMIDKTIRYTLDSLF